MSRGESDRIAATFIVRMWTEHGAGHAPQWRGQVEHVQRGEQAYFSSLNQMLDLIAAYRGDGQKELKVGSDEQASADDPEGKRAG